jgi:HD-GYP domain-containing protein (c-di-GMP phosphodiesterase class II)
MRKKIRVLDLRVGMFLHAFEGGWMDHPFWRTGFVLETADDLARAQAGAIVHCWIDTSLGLDVAGADEPACAAVVPARDSVPPDGPRTEPESTAEPKIALAEELHRASRICKAASTQVLALFNEVRLGRVVDARDCLPLVNDIADSIHRNPGALVSLARLKTQDDYSYMHSVAVCALMVSLARQLEMTPAQCREAGMAGLLHDIGKAVIPSEVLNKPGKLDDAEFALIKTHPVRGFELLRDGAGASELTLDVCLHHHEKFDGSGYPHGLAADAIHLFARMGAVCDVYDAITSDRPYKAGWDPAESVARMAQWSGHFDPAVFKAFVASIGIYPTGSLVALESKRVAVVVEQRPGARTKPLVKAFFSQRSTLPIPPVLIDLSAPGCTDRISGRQDNAGWNEREVATLWAGDAVPKGFKTVRREPGA